MFEPPSWEGDYLFNTWPKKGVWSTGDKDCPKCETMLYARLVVIRCTSYGHGKGSAHQPLDLLEVLNRSISNPIVGTKRVEEKIKCKWILPHQTKQPNMFFRQLQTECWVGNGTHYRFLHRPMYDYFHSYPIGHQKVGVKITHLKMKKSCFSQITTLRTFFWWGLFSFFLCCLSLFIRSSSITTILCWCWYL